MMSQQEATRAEPYQDADTLPASLLELRTPSQLCCWANGCFPLPPVIPLCQHIYASDPRMKIAIQMPENAKKHLQELAGSGDRAVKLRTIAVQSAKVLLDEEAEQPPVGKALWINLPTADLRIGIVYVYILALPDRASAAPQQLKLFASLPMLALPTAIGSEMEDLFGAMIQEMSSREEAGESSSTCGSEGDSASASNGGSSVDSGEKGKLQRRNSAPVVSVLRVQKASSDEEGSSRWRDRMQVMSMRSENVQRDSTFSDVVRTGAGDGGAVPAGLRFLAAAHATGGIGYRGPTSAGTMYSPASLFSPIPYSQLPSPSSSQAPPPSPPRRFSLNTEQGYAYMTSRSLSGLSRMPDFSTSSDIGSQPGTSKQAAQSMAPPPICPPDQQNEQQLEQKRFAPAGLAESGNLADSAPPPMPSSPSLSVAPIQPGVLPDLQTVLPDDVAETLSSHMAGVASLNISPSSHTLFRSAASACNLALSLLSNRSSSVRSFAKSTHDGFSSYAGLIAASKRMNIYSSSTPLVAATFSTHFGPLSADLGYVLETAERCAAFRCQNAGDQTSPAGALNATDSLLLADIIEDMSRLFSNQGTTLCLAFLRQAAKKLEGTDT